MADRKINIVQGKNFVEGFADAFQILYNSQKGFIELQLCEEIPIMPMECVIDEADNLSVVLADSPYVATRLVNARFKMPLEAAWKLGEILLSSKPQANKEE